MQWTGEQLLKIFPSHSGEGDSIQAITYVSIDSRDIDRQTLFVPIIGDRLDGHQFVLDVIKRGGCAALWQVDHALPADVPEDFPIFFVEDTLQALQRMAQIYLKDVGPTVVGVTGSNGKTSTKDMIEAVLAGTYHTYKTQGNLNNHIGVPLTILAMPEHCDVLILEMGMNHFGEISVLSHMAKPDIGVITNIGESHIEYLGSRKGIAQAKMEILDGLTPDGLIIYDGDEALLQSLQQRHAVSCGYLDSNQRQITQVQQTDGGMCFTINDGAIVFAIPMLGNHLIKNAVYAITVAEHLGVEAKKIMSGLAHMILTNMRFQHVHGKQGSMLINDAYNASPTSMRAAIETMKNVKGFNKRILILGDMLELGEQERVYHEQVADTITQPITHLFAVGSRAKWLGEQVQNDVYVRCLADKKDLLAYLEPLLDEQTIVLFKASRALALETVVNQLQAETS